MLHRDTANRGPHLNAETRKNNKSPDGARERGYLPD